jgi:hypothetical protein
MIWTASQVATIVIARVQSKFSMTITPPLQLIADSAQAHCGTTLNPKSVYDSLAPTTTNTIPPTFQLGPGKGEKL